MDPQDDPLLKERFLEWFWSTMDVPEGEAPNDYELAYQLWMLSGESDYLFADPARQLEYVFPCRWSDWARHPPWRRIPDADIGIIDIPPVLIAIRNGMTIV